MINVAVDAMGGDNAPGEIVKGAVEAVNKRSDIHVLLVGQEEAVKKELASHTYPKEQITLVQASEVIETEEPPVNAIRKKKDSSIVVGMKLVKNGEADAFVSAGSSGAVLVGGQVLVGRIKGVERPPFGALIPTEKGVSLLLDCGANADCTAEHLKQFAQMGAIYSEKFVKVQSPRVALANIGTEDSKGDRLRHEAFDLLKDTKEINFIGNVETRDVPYGCCDVLVADGFTGNIILKLYEGVAGAMMANIKSIFKKSSITMLAAMMVKGGLLALKVRMDYSEFGGAPLLGVNGVVIKAHGSSDAKAIRNAIRQAKTCAEKNIVGTIAQSVKEAADAE